MFHLQAQYTADDLKEAFQSIDRCNRPRLSKRGRVLTASGLVGLGVAIVIAAVLVYIANGPGAAQDIVVRLYILVLTDLFVLGIAICPVLFIPRANVLRYMSALALILGIEVVLKNIGHAVFPSVPAPPPLPESAPDWIRFLGNNSLFWIVMLAALWIAVYYRLSHASHRHSWNLVQQLHLPAEITLTDEMFRSRTATVDQQYQWEAFCRWLETPNLFILQPSLATMEMIPKRCCKDASEVEAIRAVIQRHSQLAMGELRQPVQASVAPSAAQ